MAFNVRFAAQAEHETDEAFAFIARDGIDRAVQWLIELQERVDSLGTSPERFPLAPEADDLGLPVRQALHGPFRILYVVEGRHVTILHVRHGARRPLT